MWILKLFENEIMAKKSTPRINNSNPYPKKYISSIKRKFVLYVGITPCFCTPNSEKKIIFSISNFGMSSPPFNPLLALVLSTFFVGILSRGLKYPYIYNLLHLNIWIIRISKKSKKWLKRLKYDQKTSKMSQNWSKMPKKWIFWFIEKGGFWWIFTILAWIAFDDPSSPNYH